MNSPVSKPGEPRTILGFGWEPALFGIVMLIILGVASYYIGHQAGYNDGLRECSNTNSSQGACDRGPQNNCEAIQCQNILDEPVIYLYPTKPEPVNVQVSYPAGFSYTNPAYNPSFGWRVAATPSGQLTNLSDGKPYPYLIWEGNPPPITYDMKKGFVVPGDQTEAFLRTELAKIGLSPTESDAFIAYWLPRMRGNKYNLIHFAGSEYTNYAKLKVTPQPDSVLRVLMAWQPLQRPVSVTPQTFPTFQRRGFTVVEWGGTER